jgi:hypothetical protein
MRFVAVILVALAGCSSSDSGTTTTQPPATNPIPSVAAATPNPVLVGSPSAAVTVTGSSFIASSTVQWNGQSRPTSYVSATQLTAQILATDFAAAGTAQLTVFTPNPGGGSSAALAFVVVPASGVVVRDAANNISWLADANLGATNRFGLPVCTPTTTQTCVNASGSMTFQAATAWVAAMNVAAYLGRTNWQLPTFPDVDATCPFIGPHGEPFGFGCTGSSLGSLYSTTLGLKAPNTAVPIPTSTAGPFANFQPYLYWSGTEPPDSTGRATFSFSSGFHGSNTLPNYLYVLPMIQGRIAGTPAPSGTGLQVNPGGQSIYDPVSDVTWTANANLAATNAFGLPACTKQGTPNLCVSADGAMNWNSAAQFITNMNAGTGYLGQKSWAMPPENVTCGVSYTCAVSSNTDPMAELYYGQLALGPGAPVVPTPTTVTGGFIHLQPYLYWGCSGTTIQSPCRTTGPVSGFEWSFSFGNGFQGTDVLKNSLFATVYFVGP